MNETKLIPNIRFKGFKNNWKIEHLKDIGAFKSGIAFPKTEQGGFKGTPFYKVSDLGDNLESKLSTANNYVTNKQIENNKWKVIDSSFNGAIVFAKIGAAIFLNRKRTIKNKFLMDNNLMAYIISDRANCAFIVDYLQKIDFSRFAQVGALPSIDKKDLERIGIYIPTNTFEQQKIGDLFAKLDRLLDLQQQKLDQLELLKKALLQKLFPKQGTEIPELRFKGFAQEWKKVKMSQLVSERSESVVPNNQYPLMAFIAKKGVSNKGERYNRDFLVKSEKKKYKKTEYGDLIYSSNNLEVGSIGINRYGNATISPVYSIFKVNKLMTYNFMGYFVQRKTFINNMIKYRQGVTYGQWKIHESDFLRLQEIIPNYNEQQKIGNFLAKVDHLIEVENKKLNNLKLVKKSLLQNMFVE